jgi:hypothetical protein
MVTTLAAFRAADKGQNTQTVSIVLRGTDGELYVVETDPLTGSLPVTIISGASGIATEATLAAIESEVDDLETLVTATNSKLDTLHNDLAGVAPGVPQVNVYLDTALDDIPTGSWQDFGSVTSALSRWCTFYNGTGYSIQLGWGSAKKLTITPAGWSGPLAIPASTQLQVQSETGAAITSGLVIAAII